jgi:rhomboid protease GluP
VLDLNHILLFIACISPLLQLAQTWRGGGLFRGWRVASFVVLLVTGVAWIIKPDAAGFVGGGAWFALLLIPAIGLRKIAELSGQQRYAFAGSLARSLCFFHPAGPLRGQAQLFRAMTLAQAGDLASALALLAPLRNNETNVGRQAMAQSFRLRGEWISLVEWARRELPPAIRASDFALIPVYLRALGETGARDELLLEFATMATVNPAELPGWSYQLSLLIVLAFSGRLGSAASHRSAQKLSRDLREFWLGSSELASGDLSAGRARLERLRSITTDHLLQTEIGRRLDDQRAAAVPLSPRGLALLRRIEESDRPASTAFGSDGRRPTRAVLIFIALNLAMFLAELTLGGSTNSLTLHRLGALEPWAVRFEGEYWRLLTSLFLHYGPLHLIFNLYALFIIGPGLERALGSMRFAFCYLLSGLGSSAGVLLLRFFEFTRPEQLVGASGCVMGVVGAWAGFLLRHRSEPMAGRRLKNIVLIVGVQTAFDVATPQVSMAAHLGGLATGVALGLLVRRRRSGG